ncbi:MAG: radical SAM protein, partial [Planctomycetota bacterium]
PPARRFEAVRRLSEAGLPVNVFVAPLIPGLNDRDIPKILKQAAAAGARFASYTALRLPGSVESVFVSRLREVMPLRADRVLNRLRDIRGGPLSESRFGKRMRGSGTYWESIRDLFAISRTRYGLDRSDETYPVPEQPAVDERRADEHVQLGFDFRR